MPQDTQETVGGDAAQVDAAKALIAQVLRDAWPHGHASANISMNGNCHVYVHRYGQCEIGYGADFHDALADVIGKAEKAWPTAEQAQAAKIAKLRAELAAAEADMVQP